jgi:hypothetical protein
MKRRQMWVCLLVAFAIGGGALAQTPSPNEKKTISITWLGHAAFEIVSPGGTALTQRLESSRYIPQPSDR